jgi:ABC-type bacteriocin/lantibiotic exporter with double-glycine peptidase domain
VLLLDDCTSALDSETEMRVCAAVDELLPDCTRIIVSHKLAAVSQVDWLVVLQDGRIVRSAQRQRSGVGTPVALKRTSGAS